MSWLAPTVILLISVMLWSFLELRGGRHPEVPDWVDFPNESWERITPEETGLDQGKFISWVESQDPTFGVGFGGQEPAAGGAVITRGGYILHTWGDPNFRYQNKSTGKVFTRLALQLALDRGLIDSLDDPVRKYWTGEGQLSSPHKYLTKGHHTEISFRHFIEMTSGFPVSNGYFWERKINEGDQNPGIPEWAEWTGDPDYDNYAHVEPGKYRHYSSGGYWRLSQALTAIWDDDLKSVLDELIMSKIGIPAHRWDWLSGEYVRSNIDFYPALPDYGSFVDKPYTINGHKVRGGGGWVVMSASDLARLGLLYATGGVWEGERIISKEFGGMYLPGNGRASRGGINAIDGWGILKNEAFFFAPKKEAYFSFAKIAGDFQDPTQDLMASWVTGPVQRR